MSETPSERRSVARRPIQLPLVIYGKSLEGKDFCEITASINISAGGAYFLLWHPVPEHGEVEIAIIPPNEVGGRGSVRFMARGRVVRRMKVDPTTSPAYLAVQFTERIRIA